MEVEQQHDKGGDSKESERELRKFWNAKTCVELGLLKARGLVSLKANENTCFLKLYKTFLYSTIARALLTKSRPPVFIILGVELRAKLKSCAH